ncbi:MAG: hypothetical protein F6K48_15980 [Okeania sp. SIO3H1]|nr:hypothetical protein [Okeania sp. SIO3H1]
MEGTELNGKAKNLPGFNEGEDIVGLKSSSEKVSQGKVKKGEDQYERNSGGLGTGKDGAGTKHECQVKPKQATVLECFKKLTSRLELNNKRLNLLESKYFAKIDEHRDRLILRLEENRKFTAEFKSEAEDLRKELQELESTSEVLGALIEQLTED